MNLKTKEIALKVGQKVQIEVPDNYPSASMVGNLREVKPRFLVIDNFLSEEPSLRPHKTVWIKFYDRNIKYAFKSKVLKISNGAFPKLFIAPPQVSSTPQKRRYVRLEINLPIKFQLLNKIKNRPLSLSGTYTGKILNLSLGGLLLFAKHRIPKGSFLTLQFDLKNHLVLKNILGKVKRIEKTNDKFYLVGIEFTSLKEAQQSLKIEKENSLLKNSGDFVQKMKELIESRI